MDVSWMNCTCAGTALHSAHRDAAKHHAAMSHALTFQVQLSVLISFCIREHFHNACTHIDVYASRAQDGFESSSSDFMRKLIGME